MKTKTAIILAAGYGKRLLPLTKKIPKPLVKVYGKPLLGHTIDALISIGIKNIIINTHYKSKQIKDYVKFKYKNLYIKISYEKELLDTGGGVKNARRFFNEKFILVINSDILWNKKNKSDLKKLINMKNNTNQCTLLLSHINKFYGFEKKIGDFIFNKNYLKRNSLNFKGYIFSGAQVIDINILKYTKRNVFSFNIIWDYLIKRKKITGIKMKNDCIHLGNMEGLRYLTNNNT